MDTKKIYTGQITRDRLGNLAIKCQALKPDFGLDEATLEPCHFFETFASRNIEPELGDTIQFTVEQGRYLCVDIIISHNGRVLYDLTATDQPPPSTPEPPRIIMP